MNIIKSLQKKLCTVLNKLNGTSNIPIGDLGAIDACKMIANYGVGLKKIGLKIDITRKEIHMLNKCQSDNLTIAFENLGVKTEFLRMFKYQKRYDYLMGTPCGRNLLSNLIASSNIQISPQELTQANFNDIPGFNKLLRSHANQISILIKDLYPDSNCYQNKNLPQGFLNIKKPRQKFRIIHEHMYSVLKKELNIVQSDWRNKTSASIKITSLEGKILMTMFDYSINQMCFYFEGVYPYTSTKPQAYFNEKTIKQEIISVISKHEINKASLISTPLQKLIELGLSKRIPNWLSENKIEYSTFLIEQFPEYQWKVWLAYDVPDFYWVKNKKLNIIHIREALQFLLQRVYNLNHDELNNIDLGLYLGLLTDKHAIKHKLGGMLIVTKNGILKLINEVYPELDIKRKEKYLSRNNAIELIRPSVISNSIKKEVPVHSLTVNRLSDDIRFKLSNLKGEFVLEIQGNQHYNENNHFHDYYPL